MSRRVQTRSIFWDRTLSVITGVFVVIAGYFLFTERLMPAFRTEPMRVSEGGTLADSFTFRRLDAPKSARSGLRYIPDEKRTLLLFYDSRCPACYENLPAWQRAIGSLDEAARRRTTILAVALEVATDVAEAYARRHLPEAMPVQSLEARELLATLGVTVVPFTAVVEEGGEVSFARPGRLGSAAEAGLIRALGRPVDDLNPLDEWEE